MPSDSSKVRTVVPPESLAGKKVLVMGLGRFGGGVGVAKWLVREGAVVTVTDVGKAEELAESVKALDGLPIAFKLGGHEAADFLAADLLVINPAVDKKKSDVVQAALNKGVPYTTEMNLFVQRCRGKTIGITGSVGKSTTTALLFEALKAGLGQTADPPQQEGPRVFLGGNIGRSLLLDLPAIREQDWVVLELSSFMLEETPQVKWSPHIAVVTNVFPNHLDRHETMAGYTAAKQNILRFQGANDVAVLNNDHELVSRWVHLARGKVVKFSTRGPAEKRPKLLIPGSHNQSNAAATLAVLDIVDGTLNLAAARQAIEQFPGLAHRLQCVHVWNLPGAGSAASRHIRFYNDSKATTPDASITALKAFEPGTAIFIVGGYDKHIDLSEFEALLAAQAGGVIGIGETGQAMVDNVRKAAEQAGVKFAPHLAYAGTLEAAVTLAREWIAAGSEGEPSKPLIEAIVLSPASASWDQFANYEKRGEQFAGLSQGTGGLSTS